MQIVPLTHFPGEDAAAEALLPDEAAEDDEPPEEELDAAADEVMAFIEFMCEKSSDKILMCTG
jgi:hypothetical protein